MAQQQPDVGQFIGMATEALKQHETRLDKQDLAHSKFEERLSDVETKVEVNQSAQAVRYGFYAAIISGLLGVAASLLSR